MGMLQDGVTFLVRSLEDIKNAQEHKESILCLKIETIEEIPNKAFFKFDALEQLIPHNNLRVIGSDSFAFCKKLQDIGNLSSIETVGEYAFQECALESVVLTNAVNIGKYAFVCCKKIESIEAPKATQIGGNAFSGCTNVDPSKVVVPYDSGLRAAFDNKVCEQVYDTLHEKESKTYRKIFNLYLINFWECALRVQSCNTFGGAQPQPALYAELCKQIEQIAKNHSGRNGTKGATYLQGGDILNMIHEPILRKMPNGGELKFNEGEYSVWVIPIGAYEEVVQWLHKIGKVERVISENDREFAQLAGERAVKNKYEGPSTDAKELQGVPLRLRNQLTTWQREGVAFCVDRNCVCLLGDEVSCCIDYVMRVEDSLFLHIEAHISLLPFISLLKMGLGKTIQSIASMSAFSDDWPLLIICPAVAAPNWKAELLKWLKENKNSKKDDGLLVLNDHNVVMLNNRNDVIEKSEDKLVFIASYEKATKLVREKKLIAGMFQALIIDESHKLSSKQTLRTKAISQIAAGARRILLLSGTPALSDPKELNPQISLLEANKDNDEIGNSSLMTHNDNGGKSADDLDKLLNASQVSTMLNLKMIRRLKCNVTKLPTKTREFVQIDTGCEGIVSSTQTFLRTSKGRLANIMRVAAESDDYEIADTDTESRSQLVEMRLKTGKAKVPRVLEELNGFINNEHNKGMKLCIFAHHQIVLDMLEAEGESLTMDSFTKRWSTCLIF